MSVLVIPEDFRKDRYIPKPCETLPGNISECGTLADAMDWLRAECTPEHPLPSVVMDTGIATEANLAWLRRPVLLSSLRGRRVGERSCLLHSGSSVHPFRR